MLVRGPRFSVQNHPTRSVGRVSKRLTVRSAAKSPEACAQRLDSPVVQLAVTGLPRRHAVIRTLSRIKFDTFNQGLWIIRKVSLSLAGFYGLAASGPSASAKQAVHGLVGGNLSSHT